MDNTIDILKDFKQFDTSNGSHFISLEGIEGAGKSSQLPFIKKLLEARGKTVTVFREPGGTDFGETLRKSILSSEAKICPLSEALLFASSRAQLMNEKIAPLMNKENQIVLCDRFMDSSLAYQGFGGELGQENILKIHSFEGLNVLPNITLYFKIDYKTSKLRQDQRGQKKDYFESKNEAFYKQLIDGFDRIEQLFPSRVIALDATRNLEQVQARVEEILDKYFG